MNDQPTTRNCQSVLESLVQIGISFESTVNPYNPPPLGITVAQSSGNRVYLAFSANGNDKIILAPQVNGNQFYGYLLVNPNDLREFTVEIHKSLVQATWIAYGSGGGDNLVVIETFFKGEN